MAGITIGWTMSSDGLNINKRDKVLLTLKQFVQKYKDLNMTESCLRTAIKRNKLLGIKTSDQCVQVDPNDVFKWQFKLNEKNPKAIAKLNEIYHGKEFVNAVASQKPLK